MNTQYLIYSTADGAPTWHGAVFSETFETACDKLAMRNEDFRRYFNKETMTFKGYPLYPSYQKAVSNL